MAQNFLRFLFKGAAFSRSAKAVFPRKKKNSTEGYWKMNLALWENPTGQSSTCSNFEDFTLVREKQAATFAPD